MVLGGVDYDQNTGKLAVADYGNRRVLIWNSIPTTSGVAADVVLGQANFTSGDANRGGSVAANTMNVTYKPKFINGKLLVSDTGNNRVLIWNSIPTTNGAAADVVIGQQNFTSNSANQGGSVGANTLRDPAGIEWDGKRLFIGDAFNHRILIYNGVPGNNNASAYMVIGQTNFTSSSANQGGSAGANTFEYTDGGLFVYNNNLYVADEGNHRVLVFNNLEYLPGITLSSSPSSQLNNLLRFSGTANVSSPYVVNNVQYSLNTSSFQGGVSSVNSDGSLGSFGSTSNNWQVDVNVYNPTNAPKDKNGNTIPGYTMVFKAETNNLDTQGNALYFNPFNLNSPSNNAVVTTPYPAFSFTVSGQRQVLKDNLDHYAVVVNYGNGIWKTLIDNIPPDFSTVSTSTNNLRRNSYLNTNPNNGNGTYETTNMIVTYSGYSATDMSNTQSPQIQVTSKVAPLNSNVSFYIAAVDKAGHTQQTATNSLMYVPTGSTKLVSNYQDLNPAFPLALTQVSSLGRVDISTFNGAQVNPNLTVYTSKPNFSGIAFSNSKVTATLTDVSCATSKNPTNCTQTTTTTAAKSVYSLTLPNSLKANKQYLLNLSVQSSSSYNQLPALIITPKF